MFCRQKSFVCDRRPVFECRQNAIVWNRRRWRVSSCQPSSSGVPTRDMAGQRPMNQCGDLVVDALPHWKPVQLAKHRWDVVASSRASDLPGCSVLHRLQTSHQLVGDAVVQCVAPVQAAGNESPRLHFILDIMHRIHDLHIRPEPHDQDHSYKTLAKTDINWPEIGLVLRASSWKVGTH